MGIMPTSGLLGRELDNKKTREAQAKTKQLSKKKTNITSLKRKIYYDSNSSRFNVHFNAK